MLNKRFPNNTQQPHQSQQQNDYYYTDPGDAVPVKEFTDNPSRFVLDQLSAGQRKQLNFLLFLDTKHNILYPSQTTLAKNARMSRQQVNTNIKKLVSLGLISKHQRMGIRASCIYRVSSIFKNPTIRMKLRPFFTALKFLPLVYLTQFTAVESNIYKTYSRNFSTSVPTAMLESSRLGRTMSEVRITDVVQKIRIPLTEQQKRALSCYPDSAVLFAERKVLPKYKELRDPGQYMIKVCKIYCEQKRMPTGYTRVEQKIKSPEVQSAATQKILKGESSEKYPVPELEFTIKSRMTPIDEWKQFLSIVDLSITHPQHPLLEIAVPLWLNKLDMTDEQFMGHRTMRIKQLDQDLSVSQPDVE